MSGPIEEHLGDREGQTGGGSLIPSSPVVSEANAEHYLWGEGCDGWHLVRTAQLSIIEEQMPPGTSERRHLHAHARQFFYVLAGELSMEVDGTERLLRAGEGLEVSPGAAHRASNRGSTAVRFLVTSHPPSHGDRTEA